MPRKKSWREKLAHDEGLPRVEVITEKMSPRWGKGTVVIPAPKEVDQIMKGVSEGNLITIGEIRDTLARRHSATICCPLTTGIFAWVAAHAAQEEAQEGKVEVTPYWRTLKSGGELNPKYPGGVEGQARRLEMEGHKVIQRGRRYFVENFRNALMDPL